MKSIRLFIRLTRPIFLLGGFLLFALGGGIAYYQGAEINWEIYFIGQAWVTMLQLSTQFLNEYFNSPEDATNTNRTFLTGGSGSLLPGALPRRTALLGALSSLAILASLTVLFFAYQITNPGILFIMVLSFLGAFFYSVPPIRLERSGYGELTTSILIAFLLPLFSFMLQNGEYQRIVLMTTFPLVTMHLAMLLAFELPDYGSDLRNEKRTLMIRLGWNKGIILHNLLILSTFFLLFIGSFYGIPKLIFLSGVFVLPLGLFQIWQMQRIVNGGKPNWNLLTIAGLALFSLLAYLFTLTYWTT